MSKLSILTQEQKENYVSLLTHKIVSKKEDYQLFVNGIKLENFIDEKLYLRFLFLSSLFGNRLFYLVKRGTADKFLEQVKAIPKNVKIIVNLEDEKNFDQLVKKINSQILMIRTKQRIYLNQKEKLIELNQHIVLEQIDLLNYSAAIFLPEYAFKNYDNECFNKMMDSKVKYYYDAEEVFDLNFDKIIENIRSTMNEDK